MPRSSFCAQSAASNFSDSSRLHSTNLPQIITHNDFTCTSLRDIERFEIHERLYKGKNSRVYTGTDRKTGTPVAIKLYRKHKLTALHTQQVERESRLHASVPHPPNIVKLYASFEDANNYYLIQELAHKGDLTVEGNSNGVRY